MKQVLLVSWTFVLAGGAVAEPPRATPAPDAQLAWKAQESPFLGTPVQLTFAKDFIKAGEAYFAPDWTWLQRDENLIVFQATRKPEGDAAPDPFYAMYVARLTMREGVPVALQDVVRKSPPGSANSCGWFDPSSPGLIFGSTLVRPTDESKSGFQVGTRRYVWMFPTEMEIVRTGLAPIAGGVGNNNYSLGTIREPERPPTSLFSRPNYDAECSFDATGRFLLYAHIEDEPADRPKEAPPVHDANIYIYDTNTKLQHAIIVAPGYDGGPFFSPDGRSICYRSDRKGNDELQLFVADLKFERGADGMDVPVGITREWQITNNQSVNWAPYWFPTGDGLLYASSAVSHANYEVFAIEVPWTKLRALAPGATPAESAALCRQVRVTYAPGADVLPALSPDGKWMMWTSQRQGATEGETRASSQLWIAPWKGVDFGATLSTNTPEPGTQPAKNDVETTTPRP
jgi:TolB protein